MLLLVAKATNPRKRQQGSVDELPSGALRVRVYAGTDPITKRRHDLVEVIPAGPDAWDHADEARRRFLAEIKQRRNPRTGATIDQLLDRYLDQHHGGKSTVTGYSEYVDKHVRPFIGKTKVGEIDADILDSLYAELQRCRDHCKDRHQVHHRTRARMNATSGAGRTVAGRSGTRRSGRFTTSSAAPTSAPSGGGGSPRAPWTRPSHRRCRRLTPSLRRPTRPLA